LENFNILKLNSFQFLYLDDKVFNDVCSDLVQKMRIEENDLNQVNYVPLLIISIVRI